MNFYTDGSKLNESVGIGIFCKEISLRLISRLLDYCSCFEGGSRLIAQWRVVERQVNIYSDNLASIRGLGALSGSRGMPDLFFGCF